MNKSEKEENLTLLWAAVMIAAFLAAVWFDKLEDFSRLFDPYTRLFAQYLPYALWSAAGAVALCMVYLGARRQTQDQDSRAITLGLIALLLLAISDFHLGPDLPWVIALFVAQSLIPALQAAFKAPLKANGKPAASPTVS